MTKPPKSTPHSDIDGIHEDEVHNIDAANEAGQDSGDLEKAKAESIGRPAYDSDKKNAPGR